MKKNYIILLMAVFFFLIIFSCQKEFDNSTVEINSVAETAKQEFSKLNYQAELTSVLNDTADLVWRPAWSKSYEKTADSIHYIYTPLQAVGVNRESAANFTIHTLNIAKLLLIKKAGGTTSYYIQTFFSTDTAKRSIERFSDKHFDFNRFSGTMHMQNIKSKEFLKYALKNGKYEKSSAIKQTALATQSCSYETICDWNSVCNGGLTVTVTISAAASYPYAHPCPYPYLSLCQNVVWTQTGSRVRINCSTTSGDNPLPPPVPDTGGGPLTPGDNNTENLNSPIPADSNIRKIASWCSNMSLSARSGFKNGFYSWLNDDPRACLNNYIYIALQNPAQPFKISVCINAGTSGNGSYNPDNKTLSFPNEQMASFSSIIGHELFHVFQDKFYTNGTSQYAAGDRTGFSNIEFEQALYADIAFSTNPPSTFIHASQDIKEDYDDWIDQITNNRTTFPTEYSQIQDKYMYFLEKFREVNTGNIYSSPSLSTLLPEAMLSAFKNSPCN